MKFLEKIKSNSWWITLCLAFFILLRQCGSNRELSRIAKENKVISGSVDSLQKVCLTKEQLDASLKQNMFNFLIYEDDFDKGKTSLSEIKSKIEK
jgi:hypothetical protein